MMVMIWGAALPRTMYVRTIYGRYSDDYDECECAGAEGRHDQSTQRVSC